MGWDNPGGTGGGPALPLDHDDPAQVINTDHPIDGAEHTGVLADAQIPASIARDTELHAEIHALGGANHTGAITDAQHGARGPIIGAHGHDDLDTVTADQHHAQAHAISGADHTGVLLDAQIPASIARDVELHAQLHSIIGADHSGFPGGTSTFLRADATFAAPVAAAADPVYSPGSFTVVTETGRYIPARMKLTGAQRATIQGTGRLVITN